MDLDRGGSLSRLERQMSRVDRLPIDLLLLIRGFVIDSGDIWDLEEIDEFDRFESFECRKSWRNFLIAGNGSGWKEIRRATSFLTLNRYYSKKYLNERSFRERIKCMIIDSYLQLCIDLSWGTIGSLSSTDAKTLSNLYYLNLSRNFMLVQLPAISSIRYLKLNSCQSLKDISLIDCLQIHDSDSVANYCSLSMLRQLECNRSFSFTSFSL
jgi:hypothetical protein